MYEVHLERFDGPLDLLLHLIEKAEVDIQDIFVSEITTQFLEYVRDLSGLEMNQASEFIAMAATLVYIKSKALLPKPTVETDDEEDPEKLLIMRLKEYKAIKEASVELNRLLEENEGVFTKLPEEFALPPEDINWEGTTLEGLFVALDEALKRVKSESGPERVHTVNSDEFTVRDRIRHIRALLANKDALPFEDFFTEESTHMEIIVTFMALLDMMMRNEVHVKQSTPYGRITVNVTKLLDDDDSFEYMDEVG